MSDPAYPEDALRDGREGRVEIRFDVTESGSIENCVVTKSSGIAALDEAACGKMANLSPVEAVVDSRGKPVRSTLIRTVNFQIGTRGLRGEYALSSEVAFPIVVSDKRLDLARSLGRGSATLNLDISEQGKLIGCRLIDPTGAATLDAFVCSAVKHYGIFKPALDSGGRPKSASIIQVAYFVPRP